MSMKRTHLAPIRDPRSTAVITSLWTLQSPEDQRAAAEAALSAMPAAPGLLRFNVFRGLEDFTLLLLSQWTDAAARDAYLEVSARPRAVVDQMVPNIHRDWREPGLLYRGFVSKEPGEARCLVVVRQPLLQPDPRVQRDWVDTVMTAVESDPAPPSGLLAATFFLSADGAHVVNLAEWTSADAHRAALRHRADERAPHGSIGDSALWRAVRSHPGIRVEYEVRRFEFLAAMEPIVLDRARK
ncbi:antibiotic biosynthesis monooxygenase [Cystobacter fuscus]|uniref:antibiotic biosynthesis monooxygenase n=1 Tax=Cystobacter fuscus TaxID=43 RepID=UPI002B2F6954|nr:hypothetical protein F0U63_12495 [Cystobacter fuscus]